MSGDILWDSISNLDLKLTNGTILTGSILQDETNAGDGGNGTCNVTIDALSACVECAIQIPQKQNLLLAEQKF